MEQHSSGPITIGARIKELREARGLSQRQLGNAVGATQGSVAHWEKDVYAPVPMKLAALANYFGLDMKQLVRGTTLEESTRPMQEVNGSTERVLLDILEELRAIRSMMEQPMVLHYPRKKME